MTLNGKKLKKSIMKKECIADSSIVSKIILTADEELFLKLNANYFVFIPVNVLEESLFIIIRESIKDRFGKVNFFKMKKIFEKTNLKEINDRIKALNELIKFWEVLEINKSIFELSKKIVNKFKLLPNDALIAATCKFYNINKIATFDEDFKKVDFLEIVEI